MDIFSPAQCVGYVAFVVGIFAFLQKNDRRLKFLNASECMVYVVHFMLLGNLPASASSLVSGVRSLLALRTRSLLVALSMLVIGLCLGWYLVRSPFGWLPVIASSISTVAVFLLHGIPMRLSFLTSTLLWLVNNIISGSIGGTLLEATIAVVNISTMLRMYRDAQQMKAAEADVSAAALSIGLGVGTNGKSRLPVDP